MDNIQEKRIYLKPRINQVLLDNEISLILESTPPVGPSEGYNKTPEFMRIDPLKSNLG